MIDFFRKDKDEKLNYAKTLQVIGGLSKLFSDSHTPFLHYRIMENLFCKSFNALNLSRSDTAYDAQIDTLGIGLKTFVCSGKAKTEKIAEFNKHSSTLRGLKGDELMFELAKLRNDRIELANNIYGVKNAIYHIIARQDKQWIFFETDYEKIDLNSLELKENNTKSLTFIDKTHEYSFNYSKSVLQRKFCIPQEHSTLGIKILENPFEFLLNLYDNIFEEISAKTKKIGVDFVILPLYSTNKKDKSKEVPQKSGLNQWNAGGRKRSYGEVYIPIPQPIHKYFPNFFPSRDTSFNLTTPNKEILNVKLCQDNSKALMSNPNIALANWLLKTALGLEEGELATYEKMQNLGFDSVIINKENNTFSIDIMPLDSYDNFMSEVEEKYKYNS